MSPFDALDAIMLRTSQALFGRTATLYPMKPGPAGVNGPSVTDASRATLAGVAVIRSEWSERVQLGGQGMPVPSGHFKLASAGFRHIATVQPSVLAWRPGKGDELAYDDRPDVRYVVSEPMPDGGEGLHLGLNLKV
jgi:hypothetical protein